MLHVARDGVGSWADLLAAPRDVCVQPSCVPWGGSWSLSPGAAPRIGLVAAAYDFHSWCRGVGDAADTTGLRLSGIPASSGSAPTLKYPRGPSRVFRRVQPKEIRASIGVPLRRGTPLCPACAGLLLTQWSYERSETLGRSNSGRRDDTRRLAPARHRTMFLTPPSRQVQWRRDDHARSQFRVCSGLR